MGKLPVLFIAIVFLGMQAAAGLSVTAVAVTPPGALEDHTPVRVVCEIPRAGILLYDQLVLTTDLDFPIWDIAVIVHDRRMTLIPASRDGNRLIINGASFNYPEPVPATLRVSVSGTVPANHTPNQTLLDIRQIDSDGTPYAWPSGNYTLPMPDSLPEGAPEAGATTFPQADAIAPKQTIPVTTVTIPSEPVISGTIQEKIPALPSPLPVPASKKAAPAGQPVALVATGTAIYLMRKSAGG